MLHILWMILKIILITLGIVLGLVLLILLLVLFCPIRYRASASHHGDDTRGEARVTWLFSAFSATASYRDSQRSLRIRILGIPLDTLRKLPARLRGKKRGAPGKPQISGEDDPERPKPQDAAKIPAKREPESALQGVRPVSEPEEMSAGPPQPENAIGSGPENTGKIAAVWNRIAIVWNRIFRAVRAAWAAAMHSVRRILGIPGRIRRFFHGISLTISKFYGKIDRWNTFLHDERTAAGLRLGWEELKKLLGHIFPRKISGNLVVGLDNPAATGQALALFGAAVPLHKNRIAVQPVFDRKVLEADLRMRGRVYLFYVLIRGMKLYFDKNIKFIMKEFNKEG